MPIHVSPDFPVWVPDSDGHVRGRVHQSYRARTGGDRLIVRITVGGGQYRKGDFIVMPTGKVAPRTLAHRRPTRLARLAVLVKGLFA